MFQSLKRLFGFGEEPTGYVMAAPILELLGVDICVDLREAEDYIPDAVVTLLGAWDPERRVNASIDYHPDYHSFGETAELYEAESPIRKEDTAVCLVVEDCETGRFDTYGLQKSCPRPGLSVPRLAKSRDGWFFPEDGLGHGSPELHQWLREKAEAGQIAGWLPEVIGACPVRERQSANWTLKWLACLYFAVWTSDCDLKVLPTIKYLLELAELHAQTGDPWPVCVGWSVRLSSYSIYWQVRLERK